MNDLNQILSRNKYPGRGIAVGFCDGAAYCAYFIMGRSENSRNRVFVQKDNKIVTRAFDESKVVDPSLIIYTPVITLKNQVIITNGDQTDTIVAYLNNGKTFQDALATRDYEPDAPNFTPRISALVNTTNGAFTMGILKRAADGSTERIYWNYAAMQGEGRFLHTYKENGDPLPSFEGEPTRISVGGSIDEFTDSIWNSLNAENKISLFTRRIDIKTGREETRIVNKNM